MVKRPLDVNAKPGSLRMPWLVQKPIRISNQPAIIAPCLLAAALATATINCLNLTINANTNIANEAIYHITGWSLAGILFCAAIIANRFAHAEQSQHDTQNEILSRDPEGSDNKQASLQEIDKLFEDQVPYFALQLAYGLLQKAQMSPIHVSDIDAIRDILEDRDKQRKEAPCPQTAHLKKLIDKLERSYDI
jgi:hypothetical protein